MSKGNIVEYDGKNYISVDENSAEEVHNNKCFIVVIDAGKENDKNLSLELTIVISSRSKRTSS